jgi:hypothetical protein
MPTYESFFALASSPAAPPPSLPVAVPGSLSLVVRLANLDSAEFGLMEGLCRGAKESDASASFSFCSVCGCKSESVSVLSTAVVAGVIVIDDSDEGGYDIEID